MASKLQDSCLFQRSWLCVKSQRQHLLEPLYGYLQTLILLIFLNQIVIDNIIGKFAH